MKPLKSFSIILGLLLLCFSATAQDTLVTKKSDKIIGKVVKVTETDIEYKKSQETDAPVYVIGKEKIRSIHFANGTIEDIAFDEMDINKEIEIIDKRTVVKIHFFAPLQDHFSIGYERCIKVGTNIDASISLINNSMFDFSFSNSQKNNLSRHLIQGAAFRIGPKFLLGNDYYIKGMKYAHPMKGRYFKPEIIFTAYTVHGLTRRIYTSYYQFTDIYSDLKITALSLMLNYGRQFILGNSVTFGYSIGAGYAITSGKYTNPDFNVSSQYPYYYSDDKSYYMSNLFTHLKIERYPLVIGGTVTLGYVFK